MCGSGGTGAGGNSAACAKVLRGVSAQTGQKPSAAGEEGARERQEEEVGLEVTRGQLTKDL